MTIDTPSAYSRQYSATGNSETDEVSEPTTAIIGKAFSLRIQVRLLPSES